MKLQCLPNILLMRQQRLCRGCQNGTKRPKQILEMVLPTQPQLTCANDPLPETTQQLLWLSTYLFLKIRAAIAAEHSFLTPSEKMIACLIPCDWFEWNWTTSVDDEAYGIAAKKVTVIIGSGPHKHMAFLPGTAYEPTMREQKGW